MNTCYDCRNPVKIIALVAVLSLPAQAQPWHADVAPPRQGLPAVRVDLGYPGGYVTSRNCPIALRANAADVVFDGFIGYHFEAGGRGTLDMPVIARAFIQPHGAWSFNTILTMRNWGGGAGATIVHRELVIEWRDRAMKRIASKSAGLPYWSPRMPLRIGGPAQAFGGTAYAAAPAALLDRAQWYAGFSAVISPLDVWIDLPRPVRDAILGSGIHIVLVGLPRANQRLDDLDRAVLPIAFAAPPGAYRRVWPYGTATFNTPVSWHAKDGADFLAASACPYIVRTTASTWVADDVALSRALPQMVRSDGSRGSFVMFEDASSLSTDYRPAALGGVMLLISGVAWFVVRKKMLVIVAAALIACTLGVVAFERGRIRPPSGIDERKARLAVAPDLVDEVHVLYEHGPAPLPEYRAGRADITGDFGFPEDAEVREMQTAASMGVLNHATDYDSILRWTSRRQVAKPSAALARFFQPITSDDFHGGSFYWALRRPWRGIADIVAMIHIEKDERVASMFGLPPQTNGIVRVSVARRLINDQIRVTWASGTTALPATKKDVYSPPTAVIPDDVLRDIVANGGVFEVAAAGAEGADNFPSAWITVRVQEKKS